MADQIFYKLKLIAKKEIAVSVIELRFEKPTDFKYLAGQFVQFQIQGNGAMVLRSYSISSPPSVDYLEFCIKVVAGGKGSEYLGKLQIGDVVFASQARGFFVCNENPLPKYFIATGVGLAPIIAMAENYRAGETIDLLFGVRNDEDLFWQERLEAAKLKNTKFNFRVTLSRGSEGWKGLKGRVTEYLIIDKNGHYYLCGSMEMVKDVRNLLLKNGVNTKNVHFEIF